MVNKKSKKRRRKHKKVSKRKILKKKKTNKGSKRKISFSAFAKKFEPLKKLALQQWGYFKQPIWKIILRKAYEKNWSARKLKQRILATRHPADVFKKHNLKQKGQQ